MATTNPTRFKEHEVVKLLQDIPGLKVKAGDVGAIVCIYGEHVAYAVELSPGGHVIDITPGYLERVDDA